ncbi:alpha-L-arabinofuranosidase C-terminal domain-containing protein [Clostridium felsineum]|uniref:alpha-L-arabinofuranosidase C-terminal domain-containing protein n=1 Tax=Clostridium felsineum TaxID=36839 RepID=UPI00098BD37D|nr:alpha-L-arabinofuranosidase C-terminal domain-containing protein [Clostridium felsineum]URZ14459.1 Extracellular exo-alpha-L-arabinofuranosidase [Clostridium felsineum DSM 794]
MKKRYLTILMSTILTTGAVLGYTGLSAKAAPTTNDGYTLNINTDDKLFNESDMLTGLFFEDINHGADGGLYSELLQNQSFEFKDALSSWNIVKTGSTSSTAEVCTANPLNSNNTHYLEVSCPDNNSSLKLVNSGYKGITVKNGADYDFYFWARNVDKGSKITIQLEDENGNAISEAKTINKINNSWKKYDGHLKATKDTSNAKLAVSITNAGKVDLDMISLFPQDTYKNRKYGLRKDLVERLKDLKPRFLRFPGGCVVEGNSKEEMYNWKDTIGNVEERKENTNLWGYNQSYGLGFYEYFQLCEDIGAAPVPVLNCGMTCQARGVNGVPNYMAPVGPDLDPYIQNAVDLVEYANGDASTYWGKKRIEAGHKKPFNLKYMAIGNEQWGPQYHERFEAFQKVLSQKCPGITLISTAGPSASGSTFDDNWNWIKEKAPKTVVDEHYYMSPDWFLANTNRYDKYDRNGNKVFVGEYASQSNTLKSALSEGAYLTGLERNSDVVKMASYAPLFAKADDYQWSPDMIWFNGSTNYVTPNYNVQKLFSTNLGTQKLKEDLVKPQVPRNNDIKGGILLGGWSTQVQYDNVKVTDNATGKQIFSDNFDTDTGNWNSANGNWTVKDGKLELDQIADNCRILTKNNTWSNYTLEVDAKKLGGKEGFLVGFGAQDSSNFYWYNIGGWGNTKTVVEKEVDGNKTTISEADQKYGTVNTGEDYKIKIVVDGNKVSCYVNGTLTNQFTEPGRDTDVYTSTSYDSKTNELIAKVVNVADEDKKVKININGSQKLSSTATVEYMSGNTPKDVNSFDNPENVSIKTKKLNNISKSFDYDADKYSVSVIRIKLK